MCGLTPTEAWLLAYLAYLVVAVYLASLGKQPPVSPR